MLSDSEITSAIKGRLIEIDPFERDFLGPNSYDLRLHPKYRFLEDSASEIDVTKHVPESITVSPKEKENGESPSEIIIPGHKTVIVMSMERITVRPPICGIISPRSGFARLPIHVGYSMLVDTGYSGIIGASLTNMSSRRYIVHGRQRFMQIMFHYTGQIKREYSQKPYVKYLDNNGIDVPQYKIDREWK